MSFSKEHEKATAFYDARKELVMPRLDVNMPNYDKSNPSSRPRLANRLGADLVAYRPTIEESCLDPDAAIEAFDAKTKPKTIAIALFGEEPGREDEIILH